MSSYNRKGGQKRPAKIFKQNESKVNTEVTRLENQTFKTKPELDLRSLKLSDDNGAPLRPAFGTLGQKVILFANYFELVCETPKPFYRYSITVIIDSEARRPKGKKLAAVVTKLLKENALQKHCLVSDYSSFLISATKLDFEQREFSVRYEEDGDPQGRNTKTYRLLVQHNTTLNPNDLLQYLKSEVLDESETPGRQNIIQAMNVILGHHLKDADSIMKQSQNYFPLTGDSVQKSTLCLGLDVFRGYVFSVRGATGRLLLNTQVKHMATYQPLPLSDLLMKLRNKNVELRKAELFIRGARIKLTHFTPNRNKKVFGFASPEDGQSLQHPPKVDCYGATADKVRFWNAKMKSYVTVAKYFQDEYGRKSSSHVINTGTRAEPVYTIAEVCIIPVGEPYRSRLDSDQTKETIKFAVRKPEENATSVTTKGRSLIKTYSEQKLKAFGWDVGKTLIQVEARVLPGPPVVYAGSKLAKTLWGSWNMTETKFIDGKVLPKWSALRLTIKGRPDYAFETPKKLEEKIVALKKMLAKSGVQDPSKSSGLGYLASSSLELDSENECQARIQQVLRNAVGLKPPLKLLLVVLPKASTSIYNAVKKAGDIIYGIHTICVIADKFAKANEQYLANVALKFNLKLGGRNQGLNVRDLDFISEGKTMLIGIDVTHPAPGEDKAPSVASIVASVDGFCGQWPADVRVQPRREETVTILKVMITGRLRYWNKLHNEFPEQLLVYRDGVGEGHYSIVRDVELAEIRAACKELYPASQTAKGLPRITIVIVGKRHSTRFYPTDPADADRSDNTKNGTIVDRGVTEARIWDFFLQAHAAIQGTAKPAHYVVVHDEIFRYKAGLAKPPPNEKRTVGQRAADSLESITHNLCYLHGRATKAVSVCPPAYYADIACERARRWLSRLYSDYSINVGQGGDARGDEVKVHPDLEDSMFYI